MLSTIRVHVLMSVFQHGARDAVNNVVSTVIKDIYAGKDWHVKC